MGGIFGAFLRNGEGLDAETGNTLASGAELWGKDHINYWCEGSVLLGQAVTLSTKESIFENQPDVDDDCGIVFVAAGRVDNRVELFGHLGITLDRLNTISDGNLLKLAYYKWGIEASSHVYGDWSFAAWDKIEKKLSLARDHHGNTSLYYYIDDRIITFSTSIQSLLNLNFISKEINELHLAQLLISWHAYHGSSTVYNKIKRLPPAHFLVVTPDSSIKKQYWFLENTKTLNYAKRDDYVSAFKELFYRAVNDRLRTSFNHNIAVTLSGGLDSGSVAVTAANLLKDTGNILHAYTSVPAFRTMDTARMLICNELPYTKLISDKYKNIELHSVDAVDISIVQSIRNVLSVTHAPVHAAGNLYWLLSLYNKAIKDHCNVVLTGQSGNATISWAGDIQSQSVCYQINQLGYKKWLKEKLKSKLPSLCIKNYLKLNDSNLGGTFKSAINPRFASKLDLYNHWLDDFVASQKMTIQEKRLQFIKPGMLSVGALHSEMGAFSGIDVRDPTADVRIIEFIYSIPDRFFINPETNEDRWIIRESMKGLLPEEIRCNNKFGRQAADRAHRLRSQADEVESVLRKLDNEYVTQYIDIEFMKKIWNKILANKHDDTYVESGAVLLRGLMVGLFLESL